MSSKILDTDSILSENDQWTKLDLEWGDPVDLETDEDQKLTPSPLTPVFSTLDLRKTTFDSSLLFKQKTLKRSLPSPSYKDFIEDLNDEEYREIPIKQFYFISGQILSAFSVEEICQNIDEIFKSVEKLCSATSTIRIKKPRLTKPVPKLPELVHCSISVGDLSFDDTEDTEKEKCDSDDIDRFIDEAFDQLNETITNLSRASLSKELSREEQEEAEESIRESVTTLVRKFSTMMRNPVIKSPRKKRRCNDKFRELTEFWRSKVSDQSVVERSKV